jgi:energy-coupling factor transporter transmembrane protein EcfT
VSEPKKSEESNVTSENILRIADELVHQVDETKKLVLIMLIAIVIAIPVSWHVSPLLLGSPYNFRLAGIVTIFIALVFVAIGIRQWIVFSKWTTRYKSYKALQAKVDAKLDFEREGAT